jgi:hypothetical protein
MCEQDCKLLLKNKQYLKKYYQAHKEKLIERSKSYYNENKDKSLAYKKDYKEKNKEKLQEIARQKFNCSCGGTYTYANRAKHLLSKKHLSSIESTLHNVEPSNESNNN